MMLQILLNFPSSHVRLILRIYFNVIFPLLGIVGDQCCKKRAQSKLLQGSSIDVIQTTGWLRGASALYAMYTLRRSPVGWLGMVMILSGLMWLVADLVVSGFVVTKNVVDRCPFNTTSYVVIGIDNGKKLGPFSTSNVGAPWDIITRAVETNKNNDGIDGIFHKLNTDPSFRADAQDIIGSWQCQQNGQDSRYNATENPTIIVQDLLSRGLLYESNSMCATQFIGNNWYVLLAAWSSSVGDWEGQLAGQNADQIIDSTISEQWDVRAAIDMAANPEDEKVMRAYQCTMNTTALDYARGKLQAATTLNTFCNNMRSNVYHYFTGNITITDDPGLAIATTLNIILMMASTYQAGFNNPPPPIADPYQGCTTPRTVIPLEVSVIWLIVTTGAVAICGYWVKLAIEVNVRKRHQSSVGGCYTLKVPNGLLGWMLQAARSTGIEEDPKLRGLENWKLLPPQDNGPPRLARDPILLRSESVVIGPQEAAMATPFLAEPQYKSQHTIHRRPVASYQGAISPSDGHNAQLEN